MKTHWIAVPCSVPLRRRVRWNKRPRTTQNARKTTGTTVTVPQETGAQANLQPRSRATGRVLEQRRLLRGRAVLRSLEQVGRGLNAARDRSRPVDRLPSESARVAAAPHRVRRRPCAS
jgi:hypothetical protein